MAKEKFKPYYAVTISVPLEDKIRGRKLKESNPKYTGGYVYSKGLEACENEEKS